MSQQNSSSSILNEEVKDGISPSTSTIGWKPLSRRGSALVHSMEPLDPFSRLQDYAFPPIQRNSAINAADKWSSTPPPWSNSLFSTPPQDYPDIASVPMLPEVSVEPLFREQRSMSYSFGNEDMWQYNKMFSSNSINALLGPMQEEDEEMPMDEDEMALSRRVRSKSSAAIIDIWNPRVNTPKDIEDAKWKVAGHNVENHGFNSNRRRASLAPSLPSPSTVYNQMAVSDRDRYSFSVNSNIDNTSRFSLLNQRRHSLAGTATQLNEINYDIDRTNIDNLVDSLESLAVRERPPLTIQPPINTSSTTTINTTNINATHINGHTTSPTPISPSPISLNRFDEQFSIKSDEMGKGKRIDMIPCSSHYYVVEFKGGRSDIFYGQPGSKENDLVIVEADRGYDIGKITIENITKTQLETLYKQLYEDGTSDSSETTINKRHDTMYIKCIFRQATHDEISLLMAKTQDERKALLTCQSKIKQKKLNMQVIDAEYQW
ncbi:hypothetical protein BDB01DRAFT_804611 [Pilobolus umbonatus]|nr:hypothetical protein BDB01DRAFT_804611 [Pilobolus umbonatus]